MWNLENIETGVILTSDSEPKLVAGTWECGAFRVVDLVGDSYRAYPTKTYPKVSPVEFKLLFSSLERIAIKNSPDEVVKDFFELVENQRIVNASDPNRGLIDFNLKSVQDALGYMAQQGLITSDRASEILQGAVK